MNWEAITAVCSILIVIELAIILCGVWGIGYLLQCCLCDDVKGLRNTVRLFMTQTVPDIGNFQTKFLEELKRIVESDPQERWHEHNM